MSSPARARHIDVLVIDDDRELADSLHAFLANEGYDVVTSQTLDDAYSAVCHDADISVAMVDLMMPQIDGLAAMDELHRRWPRLPVVIMTGFGTIETAVAAMKRGAEDYVTKPFDREAVRKKIGRIVELSRLRTRVECLESDLERATNPFGSLVHVSESMDEVIEKAHRLAVSDVPILIVGETGTGKELLAHAIHDAGPRVSEPFLAVNCGALPHDLIESELFGVCKGAFTGATEDKPGIFRAAKKGTVFLDEIAEMPQQAQVKLLRVLQEKEVRPLGGTKSLGVDARIIAATNRPLRFLRGQYLREDLYYRLATAVLEIPPLRHRKEDIGVLARHFAEQCSVRYNREISFDSTFLEELRYHDLPGNVRELEGMFDFHTAMADPGPVVFTGEMIKRAKATAAQVQEAGIDYFPQVRFEDDFRRHEPDLSMGSVQADAIRRALKATGGRRAKAAKLLGISRDTLWRKMRDFGISAEKP